MRGAVPFSGELVHIQHNVACAEAYLRIKWYLDASSRLATIDMDRKLRAVVPYFFWGGIAGSQLT